MLSEHKLMQEDNFYLEYIQVDAGTNKYFLLMSCKTADLAQRYYQIMLESGLEVVIKDNGIRIPLTYFLGDLYIKFPETEHAENCFKAIFSTGANKNNLTMIPEMELRATSSRINLKRADFFMPDISLSKRIKYQAILKRDIFNLWALRHVMVDGIDLLPELVYLILACTYSNDPYMNRLIALNQKFSLHTQQDLALNAQPKIECYMECEKYYRMHNMGTSFYLDEHVYLVCKNEAERIFERKINCRRKN